MRGSRRGHLSGWHLRRCDQVRGERPVRLPLPELVLHQPGHGGVVITVIRHRLGRAIGSYASFDSVTTGTYTHIQVVVSRSFTISGSALGCGAVTSQSLSVPNNNPGGTLDNAMAALGVTWNDLSKTQLKVIAALSAPITISRTAPMPNLSVRFGTTNGLMCLGGTAYPSPPDISIVVQ